MKKVFRAAAFGVGLAVLVALLSLVFRPKGNTADDGMIDTNANGILAEKDGTVDVLFLGDSEADCAFVPHKLWSDYGYSSYICAVGGQVAYQSEGFLRQALRTQSPKFVFLETNHLFHSFTTTDEYFYWAEEAVPLLRYHDRWKTLKLRDWYAPVSYDSLEYQKGYHYDARSFSADTTYYMTPSDERAHISDNSVASVRNILELCEENGAELILISSPSVINWNTPRHNAIADLAGELGVRYIDLNCLRDEVPIDWQTETQDYGDHVNFSGAKKVTAYVGELLAETGLLTDHRGDENYISWDIAVRELLSRNNLEQGAVE